MSVSSASTVLSPDADLHLLRRATFGATPALVQEVRRRGASDWLEEQLAPSSINDSACDAMLLKFPLVSASLGVLNALNTPSDASNQLVQATVARQVWSKRQLFEVMVEFWSNHLNVVCPNGATFREKPVEDRAVIRPNALGRFETMLLADARSPAMLAYLMNNVSYGSDGQTPNENYGRELLQLHTVTPSSGYTEADVLDSARILTGRRTDGFGSFVYDPTMHFVGPVKVLGFRSGNASAGGGLAVGDSFLRYLARHENTAKNIARKLVIRFVSDAPPQSLVDTLAEIYLDSGTAVVPMLRALFASSEFADSIGAKSRRPSEDLAVTARLLGMNPPATAADVAGVLDLVSQCRTFGQPPLGAAPPTGYPDVIAGWWSIGTTLAKCNMHRTYARGNPSRLTRPPLSQLLAGSAMPTYGVMIDRLTMSLTQQTFRSDHRIALLAYAGLTADGTYIQKTVDKWLPDLTELVLNSPYVSLR